MKIVTWLIVIVVVVAGYVYFFGQKNDTVNIAPVSTTESSVESPVVQ